MAAPSKPFTIIADSAIDADSPITADLMEDFRDNDIHLEEWLGLSYTAAQDHDHDGTNSARITLSTYVAQGTVTTSAGWSIATGSLGFDPYAMAFRWVHLASGVIDDGLSFSMGTGSSDQYGTVLDYQFSAPNPPVPQQWGVDNHVCGLQTSGVGYVVVTGWNEYADVTAWASSGVTITTQTGTWGGYTLYYDQMIWGA